MNLQELKELVEKSENKLSVVTDKKIISQCEGVTIEEYAQLIIDNLDENERFQYLKNNSKSKKVVNKVLESIKDSNLRAELIIEDKIRENFSNYDIGNILNSLEPTDLENILVQHKNIIEPLSEYKVVNLISTIGDDKKLDLASEYDLSESSIEELIKSFSDENKTNILINEEIEIIELDKRGIISSMTPEGVIQFVKEHKDYLEENDFELYEIVRYMGFEKQIQLIEKIDELELSKSDKRKILVSLKSEAKEVIKQKDTLVNDEKEILDIESDGYSVKVNLEEGNLEKYEGLDELILIDPTEIPIEQKDSIKKLCKICPNMTITNLTIGQCTPEEYLRSEEWIDEVLSGVDENWSDIQKVAYIDNAIGKKISYSPDFGTEICNQDDCRSIWRIIDSEYGVCNGIASIEKYLLNHLDIQTQEISSGAHAFLKLINIELPTSNGEMIRGNTVLDPTWNLTAHQYGMYPENFCRSYEEIRKHDIDINEVDHLSHKNDEELLDATLEIEEEVLRDVFKSIGLAKEDGKFLCVDWLNKSDEIGKMQLNEKDAVERQLNLLKEYNTNFTKAQDSTASALENILSEKDNIPFKKCVVNRVYEKNDETKKPVQYIYLDMPRDGKLFYYVNKENGEFTNISERDFEERFECYEMDLKKTEGVRPWQTEKDVIEKDLNQSSGGIKMVADEGRGEDR